MIRSFLSGLPPAQKVKAIKRVFHQSQLRIREVVLLVLLSVVFAAFEGIGIGMLLPILQYVEDPGAAPSSGIWAALVRAGETLGIPITLFSLLVLAFIPIILRQVFFYLNARYGAIISARTQRRLQDKGFAALHRSDLEHLDNVGVAGAVTTLLGHTNMAGVAIRVFVELQRSAVLLVLYFSLLVYLSPVLSLVAIAATGVVSILTRRVIKKTRETGRHLLTLTSEFGRQVHERFGAVRLARMRGSEGYEIERFRRLLARIEAAQVAVESWRASVQVIVDPAMMLAVFAILFFGVEVAGMSLSGLGLFLFVLMRMANKAKELNVNRQGFAASIEGLVKVDELTKKAERADKILGGERVFDGLKEAIEFSDVSFAYDQGAEETRVLKGVSFTLPRGSLTAIVGSSGAGKSTLVDLIPRLRERSGGEILFDGIPIEEFDLTSLRRKIGFLTQETTLLDETLRDNLTYGLERQPSEEEIAAALEQAHATDIVERLPEGLNTRVGERGGRLSGGERQRLSLARELLLDPDILILDEPTSALDSESEAYIKASLDLLHGEKTLVVIAHRLSTVLSADQILVLANGQIVEKGTHEQLIRRGGRYTELFESQIVANEVPQC